MTRKESREQAFLLVFEWEINKNPMDELFINAAMTRQPEIDDYCRGLTVYVIEQCAVIDGKISEHSAKWKKNRINKVALAALRIGVAELLRADPEVPVGVIVHEAVEIAKLYSSQVEGNFVNAVLGAVAGK